MEPSNENLHLQINLGDLYSHESIHDPANSGIEDQQSELVRIIEHVIYHRKLVTVPFDPKNSEYHLNKWKGYADSFGHENIFFHGGYFMRENKSPEFSLENLSKMGVDTLSNYDLYAMDQDCVVNRGDNGLDDEEFDLCFAFKIRQTRNIDLPVFLEFQSEKDWPMEFVEYLKLICRDNKDLISEGKIETIYDWLDSKSQAKIHITNDNRVSVNQVVIIFYGLLETLGIWESLVDGNQKDLVEFIHRVHGGSRENIRKRLKTWAGESPQKLKDLRIVKDLVDPLNHKMISELIGKEL